MILMRGRRLSRRTALVAAAGAALAACGPSVASNPAAPTTPPATAAPTEPPATSTPPPEASAAPTVTVETAAVGTPDATSATTEAPALPRREREVDVSRIIPDVPVDAIPPLDSPLYEDAAGSARWLDDDDDVLGFVWNGDARAYPLRLMNWHEIVNETIGGRDIVVTYCPLCRSGIVFDRQLQDGTLLSFGNTGALYESAMVMYDRETGSRWWQPAGEAIDGRLKGAYMNVIPSIITSWEAWRRAYPATQVLSLETGYTREYGVDIFERYFEDFQADPGWPVSVKDDRLAPREHVLGVVGESGAIAIAIQRLPKPAVLETELDGRTVVVLRHVDATALFEAELDGQPISFEAQDRNIVDTRTRSVWDSTGLAIDGELAGSRLTPVPTYAMLWFSWVVFQPDTEILR